MAQKVRIRADLVVNGTASVDHLLVSGSELIIPTSMSQLSNDANFQSATQVSQSIAEAVVGFLTEESDPTVFDYIKEITQEDIANWNAKLSSSSLKTINSESLIGPGNIVITSSAGGVTSVNNMTGDVVLDLGQYATTSSVSNLSSSVSNLSSSLVQYATTSSVNNLSSSVSASIANIKGLPSVTSADNGKVLAVVSGSWAVTSTITVYAGSGTPPASLGNDGDIFLQS